LLIYFYDFRFGQYLLAGRQQKFCHGDKVLCEHYVYFPLQALMLLLLIHSLIKDLWWLCVTVLVGLHHSSVLSASFLSEAVIRCVKTYCQFNLLMILVLKLVAISFIMTLTV
jgi:hypothetical protein